ncbi:hypothetical protein F5887DRAFT_602532 [Amanita rubescens]|nr:hypothetical protein F5887DRAFT_602532 [Amanita rubescens]
MQKLQLGHLTSPYMQLTSEGQFLRDVTYIQQETRELYCMLPQDANFDNCSCHIYVDDYQRLQVSIEPVKRRTDLNSIILFPKLSLHDTEAMKHALLSNGIKPDGHGWSIDKNGSGVEVSQVAIDNISWTCFTIPHNVSSGQQAGHPAICCRSTFTPPSSYLETFLAQGERMLAQIRLLCATCRDVEIVAGVNCKIFFQSCFSPTSPFPAPQAVFLYVKDLQDVDDAFEISWFWAMDRKGLKRLSPADMCVLGLGELHQSKIYVDTWELRPQMWEELRVFHEIFGFAADSPDIPRFLDLPVASVEWDGGEDGPLTPWETITLNKRLRFPSGRIATTYSEDRTIFSQ